MLEISIFGQLNRRETNKGDCTILTVMLVSMIVLLGAATTMNDYVEQKIIEPKIN